MCSTNINDNTLVPSEIQVEYAFNRTRRYRIHKTCTSTDNAANTSLLTLFFTAPFVSALICIYHLPRTIITKSCGKIHLFPFRQPTGIFIHVTSRITCLLCQLPACCVTCLLPKKWLTLWYNPHIITFGNYLG